DEACAGAEPQAAGLSRSDDRDATEGDGRADPCAKSEALAQEDRGERCSNDRTAVDEEARGAGADRSLARVEEGIVQSDADQPTGEEGCGIATRRHSRPRDEYPSG